MRKLWGLVVISIFLVNLVLGAQPGEQVENSSWQNKAKIGFMGGGNLLVAPLSENHVGSNPTGGLGAFMDYQIKNNLYLNLTLDYNRINVDTEPELISDIIQLSVGGKYFLMPKSKIKPFIAAGLGPFSFTQSGNNAGSDRYFDFITNAGVGVEIPLSSIIKTESDLSERINLIPSFNYNISMSDDIDQSEGWDTFINASLGFSYDLSAPKIESKKKPNKEKIVKVKKTKKVDEKKETKKVEPKIENKEVETDKEKVKAEKVKEKPKMPAKETEPAEKPKKKEPTVEKIQEKVEKEVQPEFHKELKYMIKPHDYLAKIARNLYDDKSKWKNIWEWNDDLVGENPNLIYPYYELHLKNVPAESIGKLNYDFYKYEVADNENLRSIALKEYGSPYAWVIIYRDNKDKINLKEGLPAGTILKLRTELYNQE